MYGYCKAIVNIQIEHYATQYTYMYKRHEMGNYLRIALIICIPLILIINSVWHGPELKVQSVPGHTRVQSDCWFPYAPMSRGVVRHQVSSRIRSVESSP